jgi:hypothetical protein
VLSTKLQTKKLSLLLSNGFTYFTVVPKPRFALKRQTEDRKEDALDCPLKEENSV